MDFAQTIALSMGAAWASGINLYAAIFMLGYLGATGSIDLPPDLQIPAGTPCRPSSVSRQVRFSLPAPLATSERGQNSRQDWSAARWPPQRTQRRPAAGC
jgi:hypothetical protein